MKIGKFRIVIYVISLVLIGTVYILNKNAGLRTVTVETKGPTITLSRDSNKSVVGTTANTLTLRLEDGYYCVTADDKKYTSKPSCFTVYKKDMNFIYNPDYSSDYLATLLESEKASINTVINTMYSAFISDYVVCDGSLYGLGDLYGTVLYKKPTRQNDNIDVYKIVLRKKDNVWSIINKPVIVLDSTTFADIPVSILKSINTQKVCDPPKTPLDYSKLSVPTNNGSQLPIEQQPSD